LRKHSAEEKQSTSYNPGARFPTENRVYSIHLPIKRSIRALRELRQAAAGLTSTLACARGSIEEAIAAGAIKSDETARRLDHRHGLKLS
jgi:hypothetical protein